MHIRRATPADLEALTALAAQLGYPSSSAEIEARLRRLSAHPDLHAVYVAETPPGAVVGWMHVFISARVESDPFAEIGGLVVDQQQRRAGVGEALVAAAETWARERGLATLRVRSNVVREHAHRFYERRGFEQIKQQAVFHKQLS